MRGNDLGCVLRHLRQLADAQGEDLADGELLERFHSRREEAAFTLLVQRHGPMVLAACKRLLGDQHLAEDAFQATFLVLARRAGSIQKGQAVGGWLHGVATRVALRARAQEMSRRARERQASVPSGPKTQDEVSWQELRAILDEELAQLPEKYRAPLVLCYLEGKTHEQAAAELGWPRRSLSSRLARARELLRVRLARRGLTLSSALLATTLAQEVAAGSVPALLMISTVQATRTALAGKTIVAVSERALALAEEVLKAMNATQLKIGMALLLAAALVAAGAGALAHQLLATPPQPQQGVRPAPMASHSGEPKPDAGQRARVDLYGDPLPAGVLARMGTVRFRHAETVLCFAFSPDGRLLISGGRDDTLRVWDVASGKELRRMVVPRGVRRLALSPDGKLLASSGDQVRLWDLATGKERVRLAGGKGVTQALAWSADGKTLAVGDVDGTVGLYDPYTGQERHRLAWHKGAVSCVALSPDGRKLATCGADRTLRLGDATGYVEPLRLRGREKEYLWVAFCPDGQTLLTGGDCYGDNIVKMPSVNTVAA